MDIEFLTFVDIEIDKPKLGYPKSLTSIYGVDMNKIDMNKIWQGFFC